MIQGNKALQSNLKMLHDESSKWFYYFFNLFQFSSTHSVTKHTYFWTWWRMNTVAGISCIRLIEDKHTGTWRQRCLKKQNKKFLCKLDRNKWYGKQSTKPDWKALWGIASVFAVASVKPTFLRGQIMPYARQVNRQTTENVNYDNTDANNDNNKINVKQVNKPAAKQNIKWHSVQNISPTSWTSCYPGDI